MKEIEDEKKEALIDGSSPVRDEGSPLKEGGSSRELETEHATDFDRIIDRGRMTTTVRKSTKRAKPVPQAEPPKRPTVAQGIKNMFKYLCDKKLSLMLLWFISNGTLVAVYSGFLPSFINISAMKTETDDESDADFYTDLVMICFGVGEAVGGIAIGAILDKMGNRFGIVLTFIYMVIHWVLIFVGLFLLEYNALWFIAALFTGLADSSHTTTNTSLLGTEYKGRKEPFAVFRFCRGIGGLVFFLLETGLDEEGLLSKIFMILVAVVYVVGFALTWGFPVTPPKKKEAPPKQVKA